MKTKRDKIKISKSKKETLLNEELLTFAGYSKEFDDVISEVGFGFWQWLLILICGIGSLAESVETDLLSYLAPCTEMEWVLSDSSVSLITAMEFIGEMIGACIFGILADRHGRKFCYGIALVLLVISGVATYTTALYWQLLLYRVVAGVGVAGSIFVSFDYLAETVPPESRGRTLQGFWFFWGVGSVMTSILAWNLLSQYGWRFLYLVCVIPYAVNCLLLLTMTESPRWLLAQGRTKEAQEALKYGAKLNCKVIEDFTLARAEVVHEQGSVLEIFKGSLLKPTLQLTVNWVCYGFAYYSVVLIISLYLKDQDTPDHSDDICDFDYMDILISATSEMVAPAIAIFVVDRSRVKTQLAFYSGAGVFTLLLILGSGTNHKTLITIFGFFARGMIIIAAAVTWVVTPEFYPTEIRATAHAFFYLLARVGACAGSFWVYSGVSTDITCSFISALCFVAAVNTFFMEETAGVNLDDIQGATPRVCERKRRRTETREKKRAQTEELLRTGTRENERAQTEELKQREEENA